MMGLLTLPGPEFLVVFVVISLLVFCALQLASDSFETEALNLTAVRDPYVIAYMRGELDELIRVVTLSLTLRGLLKIDSKGIQTVHPSEIERAQAPIEKVVLTACTERSTPVLIEANSRVRAVGRDYQRHLLERGLVRSEAGQRRRWLWVGSAIVGLVLLAVAKIAVALSTGHNNILFLVLAVIAMSIVLLHLGRRRLTSRGTDALKELTTLFAHLKDRRDSLAPSAIAEATLLAAVFGVYSLGRIDRTAWNRMFVTVDTAKYTAASGGCGSSCGGGGGGGCGGGGGGCGGCGS
jgi:uncharacterized protein (TIGR04222 family)